MQRPIPGSFQGSMPAEATIDAGLGTDIETALGGSAIVMAIAAWVLTFALSDRSPPWLALKVGSGVLLAISLLGLWLRRKVAKAPHIETNGIYQAVLRRMAQGGTAVRNAPAEGGYAGLTALIVDLVALVRRTQAGRARLEAVLTTSRSGIQEGRQSAQRVVSEIRHQAEILTDAAFRVSATDLSLVRRADTVARSLETADNAVIRAIDGMTTIAASVQTTTAGAQQMSAAAVKMAEVAHHTRRSITDLDDRTANMVVALDVIERSLHVGAASEQAGGKPAAEQGVSDAASAQTALHSQAVAASCERALADLAAGLHDLIAQTADAHRRTSEIAELVGANHDVGLAVSHAVEQQGQEITRILTELYEARPGFATLRAGVEAVTLACANRSDATDAIGKAVRMLPSQAETLANLLRGLPDLAPPADH